MKKVVFMSCILGIIFSLILILNYRKNINKNGYETLYFLQISAYNNINNVSNITKYLNNYIVLKEDDNLYHVYVGITKDKKNSEKIKVFYEKNDHNIYVRNKKVVCDSFFKDLSDYEMLLSKTNSFKEIEAIENKVLKLYKEYSCENIRDGGL